MRILIFSVAYFPFVGGAEIAIKEITDRIPDLEFDLVTVNLDGRQPKQERIGKVNVYRIGRGQWGKYFFPILGFLKGSKLHRQHSYQTVWAMMANYAGLAALFFKLFHPQTRYVLSLQEGDPIDYIKRRARLIYPLFKMIFTRANLVQVISHHLGRFAREMGYQGEIAVIPNGVDLEKFSEPQIVSVSKPPGEIYLITTSRLVKKNAVRDIIEALVYLPENIKLLIIGSGELESQLKQQTADNHLENRVQFLGQKSYSELPGYLQISDIFIRPSLSEGMGNSFIEAMTAGVPVIATPVGGIVDFLIDGETGLFCQPNEPTSIVVAINKYLTDIELRQAVISRAKEVVKERYLWDDIALKMRYNLASL
jgi:glycosyltransferase involved in cell wall biosynthesis